MSDLINIYATPITCLVISIPIDSCFRRLAKKKKLVFEAILLSIIYTKKLPNFFDQKKNFLI